MFKKASIIGIYLSVTIIASVFLFVVFFMTNLQDSDNVKPEKLRFLGKYSYTKENWFEFSENSKLDTCKNPTLYLKGHFNRDIFKKEQLIFYINYLEVSIIKNGKEIYSYGKDGSYPSIMSSAGEIWCYFISDEIYTSDEIEIVIKSKYKNNYCSAYNDFINNIYLGDSNIILKNALKNNLFTIICGFVFIVLGIIFSIISVLFSKNNIKLHQSIVPFSILLVIAGLWVIISGKYIPLLIKNSSFMLISESLLLFFIVPIFIVYLKKFINYNKSYYKLLSVLELLSILFILIFIILQLLGISDAYAIRDYFVPFMTIIFISTIYIAIREFSNIIDKNKTVFLSIIILSLFSLGELANYFFEFTSKNNLSSYGILIFLIFQFFISVQYVMDAVTKAQRITEMENEITKSKIAIMLSQINPHFLYNSLLAIQELCYEKSQKAEEAIGYFANFLRGNIDALSSLDLIEFSNELNHIEAYVELEKIRFEGRLEVIYNINEHNFYLPSLTIQPLVENAIKYGVTYKKEKTIITISTKKDADSYIITIEDNGKGFDPNQIINDGREHLGIKNVRNRLLMQCNATLLIESKLNIGTLVTISIPKSIQSSEFCEES